MSKTLISIDPGKSSGVSVGTYSDTEPYKLTHAFQIEGGVEGFIGKVSSYFTESRCPENRLEIFDEVYDAEEIGKSVNVIIEKFTARGAGNAFSYRTDALEALRVEGAILAMGIDPIWRSPQHMYFMVPSGFKGNKKSLSHKWLKDNGLYVAPKEVGCKDADDVRSSILHAVSWLRSIGHKPTLEKYFKG